MEHKQFKERLAHWIQSAQAEVDELRVQINLGKMDAAEIFEKMKKDFSRNLVEFKMEIQETELFGKDRIDALKRELDNIQLQMSLGKAEAKDAFLEQKAKMIKAMEDFELKIKEGKFGLPAETEMKLRNEMEKFRLKLDILNIRYKIGKLEVEEKLNDGKEKIKKGLAGIKADLLNFKEEVSNKAGAYSNEIKKAYDSLRKSNEVS